MKAAHVSRASQWLLLSTCFWISSCVFPIDVDYPETEQKLVLNCLFTEGEPFQVWVARTTDVQAPFAWVEDAVVALGQDGQPLETLAPLGGGLYASQATAQAGHRYRVEAWAPGLPPAWAEDSLPPKPWIVEVELLKAAVFSDLHVRWYDAVRLDFGNTMGQDEFLMVDLELHYFEDGQPTFIDYGMTHPQEINDSLVLREGILEYWPDQVLFRDEGIDGQDHSILLPTSISLSEVRDSASSDLRQMRAALYGLSPATFHFHKSYIEHEAFQEPFLSFLESFWEMPAPMWGNVHGGYGLFGGFQKSTAVAGYTQHK